MAIETSLDEKKCVKGDEKIVISDSEGLNIYYKFENEEEKEYKDPVGIIIKCRNDIDKDKYDGSLHIKNEDDEYKFTYKDARMKLSCWTEKEKRDLCLPYVYPPESEPECQNVKLNNKPYSLINKWETETSQNNYKIMYRNDGESIWKEWKMVPGTNQPEKMYTRVDSNGVYVHILEAKLQHKNFSENNMESLTKTFAYIVKP
jgi:hypothetical protein